MPNKKFQVPINLVNLPSDPATGSEGDMYFNTTNNVVMIYSGGSWIPVGSTLTQEQIQDYVAPLFTHNNHTNASVTYEDLLNELRISVTNAPSAGYTSTVKHQVKLGETITKGQAVYVSSADGTNMIVSKASNASEATSSKTMGLLEAGGLNNAIVNVVTEGLIAGLDTSSANTEGDPVWLGTDGNLIYGLTNKPYAPAHLVFIGVVTRKNANNGEIFVKVQNGFELNELHTVQLESNGNITDNEVLAYDIATSLWKNQTASEAGLATATHNHSGVYQPLDADLTAIAGISTTSGILKKTASDTWSLITDNSTNWDTAYTDRNKWDGGSTGLNPATGRTSLGLGTMATAATTDYAALSGATFTGAINGTSLTLSGDLTINGTTTTINSTTISVDDKNIELGSVASPTNATADGGGITLKGTTDKTLNWVNSTSAWTSSEDFNLLSGKVYEINGTTVLSSSAVLGITPTINSTGFSLSGGTTPVAVTFAGGSAYTLSGTNAQSYTLPSNGGTLVNTGQTFYIGSTPITVAQGTGTATSLSGLTSLSVSTSSSTSPFNISSSMSTASASGGTISITSSASANAGANGPTGSNITISSTATASSLRDASGGNISIFTSASGVGAAIGGNISISTSATSNGSPGSISLSSSGGFTITSSGFIGTIDNFNIGATTAGTGKFTSLNATSIGATTAGTGVFTTLTATTLSSSSSGTINFPPDGGTLSATTGFNYLTGSTSTTASTSLQPVFSSGAQALTIKANTLYFVEGFLIITKPSTTASSQWRFGFTFSNAQQSIYINHMSTSNSVTGAALYGSTSTASANITAGVGSTSNTSLVIRYQGHFLSNATTGGTITPGFGMTDVTGAGGNMSVGAGAWIRLSPISSAGAIVGTWA